MMWSSFGRSSNTLLQLHAGGFDQGLPPSAVLGHERPDVREADLRRFEPWRDHEAGAKIWVDLGSGDYFSIEAFKGSSGSDTLVGPNTDTIWTVNGSMTFTSLTTASSSYLGLFMDVRLARVLVTH